MRDFSDKYRRAVFEIESFIRPTWRGWRYWLKMAYLELLSRIFG